jgi:hypothetical protein
MAQGSGVNIPNSIWESSYISSIASRTQNPRRHRLYRNGAFSLTGGAQPEQLRGLEVTDGTLPILGVQPERGRLFSKRDDLPDAPKTVLLTYGYWQRHFGGDPQP